MFKCSEKKQKKKKHKSLLYPLKYETYKPYDTIVQVDQHTESARSCLKNCKTQKPELQLEKKFHWFINNGS